MEYQKRVLGCAAIIAWCVVSAILILLARGLIQELLIGMGVQAASGTARLPGGFAFFLDMLLWVALAFCWFVVPKMVLDSLIRLHEAEEAKALGGSGQDHVPPPPPAINKGISR